MGGRKARGSFRGWLGAIALFSAVLSSALLSQRAGAQPGWQNPDALLPEQSAAKAQAILARAVDVLGGASYLGVRNSSCTERYAQFENSGALGDFMQIHSYRQMPDKYRVEYDPRGIIVDLYAGDQGWSLDRGGVSELSADRLAAFHEQLETDVNTILRYRRKDPALTFRYDGVDVVNLMEVEWVEVVDHLGHTMRFAFNRKGFPVRAVVTQRDPKYHEVVRQSTEFANYQPLDGVQTPFRVSHFRDEQQTSQLFYESCQYNAALPPDLFSRASLDAHFAKHGPKKNKK